MKIKTLISTLIIAILIIASSQSLTAQLGYKISNSVDLILGGDFGFRIINADNSSQVGAEEFENRSQFETFKFNYRFGINYVHGISPNLSIKTGVRLSNPGFTVAGVKNINPYQDINSIEKEIRTTDEGFLYKYAYQMVEVPLGLRYTLTKNVCEPFFELGMATNMYRRTVVTRANLEGNGFSREIVNEENIKKFNYVAFLSLGGNINLTQNISIFTQMIARYQLNDFRKNELVERMISIGLEVGVRRYLD